jgi:RNA polymerase sigma-70 factor (ECF subfamily)
MKAQAMSDAQPTSPSQLVPAHPIHGDDFEALTDPHRRELLVHCYRILGSLDDAEDASQQTFFNAWRQFDSLKSHTSLRPWLYKIATNVSLNMLAGRKLRALPTAFSHPANPREPLEALVTDSIWLDPLPDETISDQAATPETRYEVKESVTLAFLTALQLLPGRQRAVLILRDVLGWKPDELGILFDQPVTAINSLLQRARHTMKKVYSKAEHPSPIRDEQTAELVARFAQAWEASDTAGLVALLTDDAILTMPPLPAWYRGRDAIKEFLDIHIFSTRQTKQLFRVTPIHANGCPALASYHLDDAGTYRPGAILIFSIKDNQILQIDDFLALDNRLFLRFNLPISL